MTHDPERSTAGDAASTRPESLRHKINFLVQYRQDNGLPYSNRELAKFTKSKGVACSSDYVSKVRLFERRPLGEVLAAWAEYFGVTTDVFDAAYPWSDDTMRAWLDLGRASAAANVTPKAARLFKDFQDLSANEQVAMVALLSDAVNKARDAIQSPPGAPEALQ